MNQVIVSFLKGLVWFYRKALKPVLRALSGGNDSCRFDPSCSQYFLEAIDLYGPWKGSWIGIRRIFRCHPWGGFGYDPVPPIEGSPSKTPSGE